MIMHVFPFYITLDLRINNKNHLTRPEDEDEDGSLFVAGDPACFGRSQPRKGEIIDHDLIMIIPLDRFY